MNYGLQLSASGLFSALYRQDVFANNLANMDAVGFKPMTPTSEFRQSVRQEDGVSLPSDKMLERLGGGARLLPNRTDFAQGSIRVTGSPLDVAIEGNGFFQVETSGGGPEGGDSVRLTRDGRFTKNSDGELVMAGTGMRVLDSGGSPIELVDDSPVQIDGAGRISQHGQQIAALAFVSVDERSLRPMGHSTFAMSGGGSTSTATGTIRQKAVEESGVDEVKALLDMTNAAREVEFNVDLMRAHDRLSERAISALGRITA